MSPNIVELVTLLDTSAVLLDDAASMGKFNGLVEITKTMIYLIMMSMCDVKILNLGNPTDNSSVLCK